ncbi:uncharacterized protein LOC120208712 [Hibiscus syriacus]|uniref:uncharacterized protein LOC120208712 n=1 Tax=Hibiscus syriacus TaxID=106335 RepID=UPI00192119CE|nr:uncharacterized protein LOC120208712 [Hibiscus syriacus]
MGSNVKISELRKFIRTYRIEMVLLQETKKEDFMDTEISSFWCDDDFEFRFSKAMGKSGGILSVWDKSRFKILDSLITDRFILIEGKYASHDLIYSVMNVYAPCEVSEQVIVWSTIMEVRRKNKNRWFMAGDFNTIRNNSERSGCSYRQMEIVEFNSFIEACNLFDMPLSGRKFTWFGPGNRKSRLDIIFIEDDWFNENSDATLFGLSRTESYIEIIKKALQHEEEGDVDLSVKLRRVKGALQKLNLQIYWNIDIEAKRMEKRINELDMKGDADGLDDREREELLSCKRRLWDILKENEDIWSQKSRSNWLKLGGENTAFFHRAVKIRSKKRLILGANLGEVDEFEPDKLRAKVFNFFSNHFRRKEKE